MKPRCAFSAVASSKIPVTDVGIDLFAAFLAIGAVGEHVELAVLARVRIAVRLIPGIDRDARQVLMPIRSARLARILDERPEALRRARVTEVIKSVEVQRRLDEADVALGASGCGWVAASAARG